MRSLSTTSCSIPVMWSPSQVLSVLWMFLLYKAWSLENRTAPEGNSGIDRGIGADSAFCTDPTPANTRLPTLLPFYLIAKPLHPLEDHYPGTWKKRRALRCYVTEGGAGSDRNQDLETKKMCILKSNFLKRQSYRFSLNVIFLVNSLFIFPVHSSRVARATAHNMDFLCTSQTCRQTGTSQHQCLFKQLGHT